MAKARERDPSGVGLCATCRYAATQKSSRGSLFWRCLRADEDPAYRRYPPIPVQVCLGHEAGDGET
jgi:hypothetical protein